MTQRSGFRVMTSLLGLVRPLAGHMAIAVVMGVLGHLMAAFIPVLGAYGVLNVLGFDTELSLGWIFGLAVAFAVLRSVLHYLEQNRNHYIAFTLLAIIRDKVFKALRRLCPAKLEGRDRGDLINVITSDIELLEVFYAHTISPIIIAVIFSIVMVVYIGTFSIPQAVVAAVAYAVIGICVPLIISRSSGSNGRELRERSADLSSYVLESLRGLDEVQQYGAGEARISEMDSRTDGYAEADGRMKALAGKDSALSSSLILVFDLAMLLLSVHMFNEGDLDVEGLLVPTVAMMSSFGPVSALAALGSTLQTTIASGNRVLDILDEEPETVDIEGKAPVEFDGAAVRDVSFAYGSDDVLKDVSMDVPKGSIVGISGPSGCGKSTLLKLMMRFWTVDRGEIDISGRSLDDINTSDLRDMEGYVTQETYLFHDSIRNNLLIAKLDATQEEIEAACRKAAVHDFIMTLPQGYDTPVGELGDTLSGGEKQRIGLARAFLHDSDLMLLDEPTSNLDSLNEAVILRSLTEEREGRTVVLVSHRRSTLRTADTVYSMDEGRISRWSHGEERRGQEGEREARLRAYDRALLPEEPRIRTRGALRRVQGPPRLRLPEDRPLPLHGDQDVLLQLPHPLLQAGDAREDQDRDEVLGTADDPVPSGDGDEARGLDEEGEEEVGIGEGVGPRPPLRWGIAIAPRYPLTLRCPPACGSLRSSPRGGLSWP